jgi:hypothetical protein
MSKVYVIREEGVLPKIVAEQDQSNNTVFGIRRDPTNVTDTVTFSLSETEATRLRDAIDDWLTSRPRGIWWKGEFVDSESGLVRAIASTTRTLDVLQLLTNARRAFGDNLDNFPQKG